MKRALLLAASAAVLLSAVPAAALQPNCTDKCTVLITMSAGCGSGIKVAPDPIVVPPNKTVEIDWNVMADGWAFEGAGIVINQPGEAFAKGAPDTAKKRNFKHSNKKSATFKYDVILKDANGVCTLDPTIVDQ